LTGVDKLIESILAEAKNKEKEIWDETRQKQELLKQKTQAEADKKTREILDEAAILGEENKKRLLAVYGLELRKEQLKQKRILLNEVYDRALESILNLPKDEYLKLTKKLLLTTVTTGKEEIIISRNEKYMDQAFLDGVNEELKQKGKAGALHFSTEKSDLAGGFMLQEGGLFINCSFEMVMSELRDNTESEAAQILFG